MVLHKNIKVVKRQTFSVSMLVTLDSFKTSISSVVKKVGNLKLQLESLVNSYF